MYVTARIHCPKEERGFRLDVAQTVMAPDGKTRLESVLRCMEAAFKKKRQPEESVTLHVSLSVYASIDKWNPGSDEPLRRLVHPVSVERKDAFAKAFGVFEGFRNAIGESSLLKRRI